MERIWNNHLQWVWTLKWWYSDTWPQNKYIFQTKSNMIPIKKIDMAEWNTSAGTYWTSLTSNSESFLRSSDFRIVHTSFARFSSEIAGPNNVRSISPSGRYVFNGTDPNGKTYFHKQGGQTVGLFFSNAQENLCIIILKTRNYMYLSDLLIS